MRGRSCAAVGGVVLSLPLSAPAMAQQSTPGGRVGGARRLPNIGTTGYDARNYALPINDAPATNTFLSGTQADITQRATQNLSEFSLDFRGLNVTSVKIDGVDAAFRR